MIKLINNKLKNTTMKVNFKNIVKCVIFYCTVIMGCLTIGLDWDRTPGTNIFWWLMILAILGGTTYKMCAGKTIEEIKEFTGISFEE